jgi:hypothetical protein
VRSVQSGSGQMVFPDTPSGSLVTAVAITDPIW